MIETGRKAPGFALPDETGTVRRLEDYRGRWLVLYFYPKDGTAGCSAEAREFNELLEDLEGEGAAVLGVSRDPVRSHARFAEKLGLRFHLLSDEETGVIRAYGAWGRKKLYGREYEGTIRSTVLIDPGGVVAAVWPKVKVSGHARQVLEKLRELKEKDER
ncbi:peroxiredoxin [Oceanithermus sp.]